MSNAEPVVEVVLRRVRDGFRQDRSLWQVVDGVEFGPGQIVDSVATLLDQTQDFVYPPLIAIVELEGRPRAEAADEDAKDQRGKSARRHPRLAN